MSISQAKLTAIQFLEEQAYITAENKNTVSYDEYKAAVAALLKLAQGDSAASELGAHILLSLQNGRAYQVPLDSFILLDAFNLDAALTAIKGRRFVYEYPQSMVPNGESLFKDLKKRFPTLSLID